MATCFFWDWCPVSAAPWMSFTNKTVTMPLSEMRRFPGGSDLPQDVTYWMRSDGIFIFRAELDQLPAEPAPLPDNPTPDEKKAYEDQMALVKKRRRDLVEKAKLISHQIKARTKFQCIPHGMLLSSKRRDQRTFKAISTSPRKLVTEMLGTFSTDEEIRDFLSSKINLFNLRAHDFGEQMDIKPPALLLMRRQFSKCFEAAFDATHRIKYTRIKLVPLPWPTWHNGEQHFGVKWLSIKPKSFFFSFTLFCIAVVVLTLNVAYSNSAINGGIFSLDMNKVGSALWLSGSTFTALFLLSYLFIDVFLKRNPCIKAYEKAQTLLRAGNIYCDAVRNIVTSVADEANDRKATNDREALAQQAALVVSDGRADQAPRIELTEFDPRIRANFIDRVVPEGDFSTALDVLEYWKNSEIGKRKLAQATLIPLILITSIPLSIMIETQSPRSYAFINSALGTINISLPSGAALKGEESSAAPRKSPFPNMRPGNPRAPLVPDQLENPSVLQPVDDPQIDTQSDAVE